jgi:hypothetical protein
MLLTTEILSVALRAGPDAMISDIRQCALGGNSPVAFLFCFRHLFKFGYQRRRGYCNPVFLKSKQRLTNHSVLHLFIVTAGHLILCVVIFTQA